MCQHAATQASWVGSNGLQPMYAAIAPLVQSAGQQCWTSTTTGGMHSVVQPAASGMMVQADQYWVNEQLSTEHPQSPSGEVGAYNCSVNPAVNPTLTATENLSGYPSNAQELANEVQGLDGEASSHSSA